MILDFLIKVGILIFMLSIFVMVYMVFCRSHTHFKGLDAKNDARFIDAFVNRLYFVVSTVATIGYGDIAPISMRARIITIGIIIVIFLAILKVFDSFIDVYKKNISGYLDKLIPVFKEHFTNSSTTVDMKGVQCGSLLNSKDAALECPKCCIKNGMLYQDKFTTQDGHSICQCESHPQIHLYNASYIDIKPEIFKRTKGQIWYTGDNSLLECTRTCEKDKDCRFFYVDDESKCWQANIDPLLTTRTYKDNYVSGVKKNVS